MVTGTSRRYDVEIKRLEDIIQFEEVLLPFRHLHMEYRKPKIGIVGLPGEGKSLSLGFINLNQYLIWGEHVWSTLPTKYTYRVSDAVAAKYRLKGGPAVFQSDPLNTTKMIRLTGDYRNGAYSLDEINVQLADAMKQNTNVNFYLNQAEQQFRKDRMGLTYTTIDEMWVDPRLRSITDIFIICQDEALSPSGIANEETLGVNIKWKIYPMTRMLNGRTFKEDRTVYTMTFHARDFWGIINTEYKQATGNKYARDIFKDTQPMMAEGYNGPAVQEYSKYGWLYKIITDLRDEGVERVTPAEMRQYVGQFADIDPSELGKQLSFMGVKRSQGKGRGDYIIDPFKLEEPANEKTLAFNR